ncbi:MAG: tetratricopeptide repeat protein, partial [Pseudomonadota bacterium]
MIRTGLATALTALLMLGMAAPAGAVTLAEINESLGPAKARELRTLNDRLAQDNRVQVATLEAIVVGIGSQMDPIDYAKLIEEATELATDAGELRAEIDTLQDRLVALPPTERERAEVALDRARALFDAGRLVEAEAAFADIAEAAFGKLGQDLDAWEEAIDAQARTALLRGEYDRATEIHLGADAKLESLQAELDHQRWRRIMGAADAQYGKGDRRGDNRALERAIADYMRALRFAPNGLRPLDWAMTQNNLGAALQTLGKRESGTERLEQAVAAYRAALQEYTRERVPLNWAATQNNLGNALRTLGERESGTARLEQAVAAYRAALQ